MKRFVSVALTAALVVSGAGDAVSVSRKTAYAAENAKQMEYLSRGVTAVKTDGGVYLSWRIFGNEPLSQKYDVYRDGVRIATVDGGNYTDTGGFSYNTYNVAPQGETPKSSDKAEVWKNNYIDVPVDRPSGGITKSGEAYTYAINDTTVGDVDGDGEYEYIIKWDPSNSKDNSAHGYTGNVLLDCYKLDGTKLWRIDMGINIRAGAHYTQVIVYDFDGDGKAEMALRTRPGSKDGKGNYVSAAGTNLTWDGYNDSSDLRQTGTKSGHIIKGPDWLTMFNGETGEAMQTIDYYPQRGSVKSWGDSYGGRSERFLAGVAYLDGQKPSLIMCRGYYEKAAMAAYNWDGTKFTQLWGKTYTSDTSTLYAQGNHQLSVADADNDGKDEIVFGSAVMDHDGNVLNSTGHGHGDALHVSDFNNDGEQEIFQVHEEKTYYKTYGAEVRKGRDASIMGSTGAGGDCGRGVMANVDDAYALANPNTAPSLYWSVADGYVHGINGDPIAKTRSDGNVYAGSPREVNSFVYWDGDLGRELLDYNRVVKYTVGDDSADAYSTRLATFEGVHHNNSTKANAALSADLFGDWREEIAYGTNDNKALRIFTTTIPTEYKLATLMHDSQYRCAVAWQNVGYNQPPHTSYYIGSLALADGKNYLAPAAGFDTITYKTPKTEEITPDVEENIIYTSESFDNGKAGFSGGSVITQSAPYNNVLSASSQGISFGFEGENPQIYAKNVSVTETQAKAEVYNYSGGTQTVALYFAQYDKDGALVSVKKSEADIENGKSKSYDIESAAAASQKAFIWETAKMKPVQLAETSETETIDRNGTYLVRFDWRPGTSVKLTDSEGGNIVTLSKTANNAIKYATGSNEAKTADASFTDSSHWYHVEITLDFTAKAADISIMDYTANSEAKTIYSSSFTGTNGFLSELKLTGSTYMDNVAVSGLKYNVDMSVVSFNVADGDGNGMGNAKITVGGRTLTTDSNGHAAIKLKSGEYDYSVSKAAYKSAKGTVSLVDGKSENVDATLPNGEPRNIYVSYVYDGQIQLSNPVWAGVALENTVYTVSDAAKADITYTFPTETEDIVNGYEEYSGKTYTFEYDADNSDTVDVVVDEGADTYVILAYKIKRVPTETDTAVTRVLFNEDGIGLSQITGSGEYVVNEETGDKYARYSLSPSKSVSVSLPNVSASVVIEMDVMYESIDSGGNVYGVRECSGSAVGTGIGLRTTGDGSQWVPVKWGKEKWITSEGYKYPANYQNRWTHIIMVSTGTDICVTMADKETGTVYVNNQSIGMTNGVGSAAKPINKLVFGCGYGSGNAVMSIKEVKAYTVGTPGGDSVTEESVDIQPTDSHTFMVEDHISDVEGVSFDVSDIIGVSYELQNDAGETVSPTGFALSEDGILSTSLESFDGTEQYYVVIKYNDVPVKRIKLNYLTVKYIYGTIKGFGDGVSPFSITNASGYGISQVDETMCYSRTAGTAYNNSVLLTAPLWSGTLADDFVFSFDYKVDEAFYKGYMYITDGSGNEMIRMETHVYQPRIKIFKNSSNTVNFNSGTGFKKGEWYTFVIRGKKFSSSSKTLSMEIYNKGAYDYSTDKNTAEPLVSLTDMTPYNSACKNSGLTLKYQVAQNSGSSGTDSGDKQYFDNLAYYYYDYE